VAGNASLDELYEVPPPEFTRARSALVRTLREQGKTADAARAARARRPSVPLWAANRLARRHPDLVRRLVDAVERLRRAQARATDDMGAAARDHREALDALMAKAPEAVQAAGAKASPATLGRIAATLLGAATDRDVRQRLLTGHLDEEREAPGFDVFAGVTAKATPRRTRRQARPSPPGSAPERRAAPARGGRDELQRAEAEARAHARRARALGRSATALERAAARAEARRALARRALDAAQAEAARAGEAAREARRAAAEAESAADGSAVRVRELRAALAR